VAAPDYLTQHGRPADPEALPGHSCLIHSTQNGADRWRFKGVSGEYDVGVSGRFRSNNAKAVRSAALAGLGLARLPEFAITEELRNGDLIAVFRDEVCSDRTIRAYHPQTKRMPKKLRLLLDFLRTDLPERMAMREPSPAEERLLLESA
jgi:DNA-binding transcriptional LysR family regulator